MNSPVLVRLGLMLWFVFWFAAAAVTPQEATQGDPPESIEDDIQKAAMRFLDAYRTGDEPGMKSIAGNRRIDPFLVAHALLRLQLLSSGEKGDRLPAAIALGKRVSGKRTRKSLLELVCAWRAFSEEDRARETRLLAGLEKIRTANLAGAWNEATASAAALHDDLERAGNSMTAVLVRLAVVPALRNSRQTKRARQALRLAAAGMKQFSWDTGRAAARIIANPDSVKVKRPDHKRAFALLQISRTTGDLHGVWIAYHHLGSFEKIQRRYPRAILYHRRALDTAEKAGNRSWQGTSRMNLGNACMRMGKLEKARSIFERAAEDMEATGNREGIANALANLGNICRQMGRYEDARRKYTRAFEILGSMNKPMLNRRGMADILISLGMVDMETRRYQEALRNIERARKIYDDLGDRARGMMALASSGSVHLYLGHFARARDHFEKAASFFRKARKFHRLVRILGNLGVLNQLTSQYAKALWNYEEALQLTREPLVAARLRAKIAEIHSVLGRKDVALDHLP